MIIKLEKGSKIDYYATKNYIYSEIYAQRVLKLMHVIRGTWKVVLSKYRGKVICGKLLYKKMVRKKSVSASSFVFSS